MFDNEDLERLNVALHDPLITHRLAAVEDARTLLTQDEKREPVREMLASTIKKDIAPQVVRAAQEALDEDEQRHSSAGSKIPGYVFGATCPKGHLNYYDKRECCPKQGNTWRSQLRDGQPVDEVLLHCKTDGCPEVFFIELDCKGYK